MKMRDPILAACGLGALLLLRCPVSYSLKDKVVVITGGSRGLGLALAREFARHGAKIALLARDRHELERAAADLRNSGAKVTIWTCGRYALLSIGTDTVNDLLQDLEDGKEGFRKAAEAVSDPNLKVLFSEYANQRAQMAGELLRLTPAEREEKKPSVTGAMHRRWIDLKAALTSGDDHAILSECERGEDHAVDAFKEALAQDLPNDTCQLIKSQSVRILEAHNKVRELRDAAHAAS